MEPSAPDVLTCIFAHPDDEAFGPGGTIARYAKVCPVQIICVTDGDSNGDKRLGEVRQQEMRDSAAILGVAGVKFLHFPDGSLSNNLYAEVRDAIMNQLEISRPDILITFDRSGISGHLDHIAVSMITSHIFEKMKFIDILMYFAEDSDIKKIIGDDYFVYVPPGREDHEIDLTVDVSPEFDIKIQAMRAHASQKHDCDWIIEKKGEKLKKEKFILQRR